MYIREKFQLFSKYYNSSLNNIDKDKLIQRESLDISKNYEDTLIGQILCQLNGNISNLNTCLYKICLNILSENNINVREQFNVNSLNDISLVEDKIMELTKIETIFNCFKYLSNCEKIISSFENNDNYIPEGGKSISYVSSQTQKNDNVDKNKNMELNYKSGFKKFHSSESSKSNPNESIDKIIDKFLSSHCIKDYIKRLFDLNDNDFKKEKKFVSDEIFFNSKEIMSTYLTSEIIHLLDSSKYFEKFKDILLQIIMNNINKTNDNLKQEKNLLSNNSCIISSNNIY